jgi:excinuclease ABC subunit A
MCPDCNGLGTKPEMDPDLIVPDPSLTIREGAVEPWASGMERGEGWTFEFVEQLAKAFDIDLDVPWSKLSKREREVVLYGPAGRSSPRGAGRVDHGGEGMVHKLLRCSGPRRARRCESTTHASSRRSPAPPATASG